MPGQKTSLNKCQQADILQCHSCVKSEANSKNKFVEFLNIWEFANLLLNDPWIKEEITGNVILSAKW
jgi:hypothetical protein